MRDRLEVRRRVAAALEDFDNGRMPVTVIVGVPGVGKTTVLLDSIAGVKAATVVRARATVMGRDLPFGVIQQLFGPLVAADPSHPAFTGPGGPIAELVTTGVASADAAGLAFSLRWAFARLADDGVVAISIDDLQWIDDPSLRLITSVVPLLAGVKVSVAATIRSGEELEQSRLADLIALAATMELGPLGVDGVEDMIGDRALNPFEVHARTGGVPFYVESVIEDYDRGGSASASRKVAFSITSRLAHLSDDHAKVTRALAILEADATHATLAALSGVPADAVPGVMRDLESAAIATSDPRPGVVHPIVGEAILEAMGDSLVAQYHDHAAVVLEELGLPAASVATHLLHGTRTRSAERVRHLVSYGSTLASSPSGAHAVPYLRAALDDMPQLDPQRAEVLRTYARVAFAAGDLEAAAAAHRERASLLTDPVDIALALADQGDALGPLGRHEQARDLYERGLAAVEGSSTRARSEVHTELLARMVSSELVSDPRVASRVDDARARLASLASSPLTLADARLVSALGVEHTLAAVDPDWPVEELTTRALEAWPRDTPGFADDPTTYMLSGVLNHLDRFDEGVALLSDAAVDGRRTRHVLTEATALYCRGAMLTMAGRIQRARGDLEGAVGTVQFGWSHFRESAEFLLVRCHLWSGDIAGAREVVDSIGTSPAPPLLRSLRHLSRAELMIADQQYAAALDEAYASRDLQSTGIPATAMGWEAVAFDALMAAGDVDQALRMAQDELASVTAARSSARPRAQALLRIAMASQARPDALATARAALAATLPRRRRDLALARRTLAAALVADGGADAQREAQTLLIDAMQYAREERLTPMVADLTRRLAGLGVAMPASTHEQRLSELSSAEYRVAALAAEGLSNRDIAARLFVTVKTVEFHMSRVFRKLGITSRTAIAEAFALDESSAA